MGIISPTEAQSRAGRGYQSGNRFEVTLGGALSAGSNVTDHCIGAIYPGTQYGTIDYRNASPLLKIPYDVIYSPLRLTFLMASDGQAFKHFQECNTTRIISDIRSDFSFNFFEDYTGDVKVKEYDGQGNVVHQCNIINAWVSALDDVELSMENENIINRFTVNLDYEYYENL